MAISFLGKSKGSAGYQQGLSFSVSRPSAAPDGAYLLLAVSVHAGIDGSDYTLATPDGWSLVKEETCNLAGQGRRRVYLFGRVAVAGDASWTLTGVGTACPRLWEISAFAGVNTASPIKASASQKSDTNTTSHTAAGVTTVSNGDWLYVVWTTTTAAPNSIPGTMISRHSATKGGDGAGGNFGQAFLGIASEERPTAGATGTRTLTSSSSITYASVSVAIGIGNAAQTVSDVGGDAIGPRGGVPFLALPADANAGELALDQENAHLVLIVDADPVDRITEASTPKMFADGAFSTEPPETTTAEDYDPVILGGFQVKRSVFRGGIVGGGGIPAVGSLKLANEWDAKAKVYHLDDLNDLSWDDRPLHVRIAGYDRFRQRIDLDNAVTLQKCRSRSIGVDVGAGTVEILTSDLGKRFARKVQTLVYDENGIFGGSGLPTPVDPEIRGTKPPLAMGKPRHVTPKLIDRANQIYSFHLDSRSYACRALPAVYIGRNPISSDDYEVDLQKNIFQLNTAVDNGLAVTCDVWGPSAAGDTVAENIRYLLDLAGFTTDQINEQRLESYAAIYPGQSGWYIGETDATLDQVISAMVAPGGYWAIDELDRFEAFLWTDPYDEPADYSIEASDVKRIRIPPAEPPFQSVSLGYQKNWTVTQAIAEAARFTADGQVANLQHLLVSRTDPGMTTVWPNAGVQDEISSALMNRVDAEDEVDRIWRMYSKPWQVVEIEVGPIAARWKVGRIVSLTHDRPRGCSGGAKFRIAEVSTDNGRRWSVVLWRALPHPALLLETGEVLLLESGQYVRA